MRYEVNCGPLTATLRECYVLADSKGLSAESEDWTDEPVIFSIVIEIVEVEEPYRRQGHFKRFLQSLCADPRFDMVVVEGVGNPILADWLLRQGWDCDPVVMDFFMATQIKPPHF